MDIIVERASLEAVIQAEYEARLRRYPHDPPLGWRLLYSPARVVSGAPVAFIGLNPGGWSIDPSHGVFSSERGSAYRKEIENWGPNSKLQDQVPEVFRRVGASPDEVLAGNLVPFRSPSEGTLKDLAAAIAFGRKLWSIILNKAQPRIVISMGRTANREVTELLGIRDLRTYAVGWGAYTASRAQFNGGTWVGLPHLSRFAVMRRDASQPALNELFRGLHVC